MPFPIWNVTTESVGALTGRLLAAGRWLALGTTLLALGASACRPSTIGEAERKGDVGWLDQNGTPDAVAALGRMADTNPAAVAALEARSDFDAQAFRAAWDAFVRGAPWGATMLRAGLGDARRADRAASAMDRHDERLAAFVSDLEGALMRLSATPQNFNVSSALAAIGKPAREAIVRRLQYASTRGGMCRGLASKDVSADARKTLVEAPESARDSPTCVDAVVTLAAEDDPTLAWLAVKGEPGLLGAASKDEHLPCPRLHLVWTKALTTRPVEVYAALNVPLARAVTRCTPQMDGVLADAIVHLPATHAVVVAAIDPFTTYGTALHATCEALPLVVATARDSAVVRERASDAINHACKAPE
jgi:hypothetical protein